MKHVRPNVSQFAAQWTQAQPITEPEKPKTQTAPTAEKSDSDSGNAGFAA